MCFYRCCCACFGSKLNERYDIDPDRSFRPSSRGEEKTRCVEMKRKPYTWNPDAYAEKAAYVFQLADALVELLNPTPGEPNRRCDFSESSLRRRAHSGSRLRDGRADSRPAATRLRGCWRRPKSRDGGGGKREGRRRESDGRTLYCVRGRV